MIKVKNYFRVLEVISSLDFWRSHLIDYMVFLFYHSQHFIKV